MMMASFVRETRGRKAKLDARPQLLSRVTTANKTTAVEKPFLWWSNILLNQITLQQIYSILNMQIRNKITSKLMGPAMKCCRSIQFKKSIFLLTC